MTEISLSGLGRSNPLAFLALLGLLRCLEGGGWSPRVAWRDKSPVLYLSGNVTEKQVVSKAMMGLKEYSSKMKFGCIKNLKTEDHNDGKVSEQQKGEECDIEKKKSKDCPEIPHTCIKNLKTLSEFREMQKTVDPEIIAALGSDGSLKKGKGKSSIEPTPLCMMFGSGHQNFLERLDNAVSVNDDEEPDVSKMIHDALFRSWERKESKMLFRWDPDEYRPHAYRLNDPTSEDASGVEGANRLAAIGFTAYCCVPTTGGLETVSYNNNTLYWPIWNVEISLAAIVCIMRHPHIRKGASMQAKKKISQVPFISDTSSDTARASMQAKKKISQELNAYGIECVMASEIFWDGKYRNAQNAGRVI